MFSFGEGFTWQTRHFGRDVRMAARAWEKCRELLRDGRNQLVILDEMNYCLKYNFLDVKNILSDLRNRPSFQHVILTGNGAPKALTDAADLVTSMKCVKHPYQQGVAAQPGIEF
jgi:cob(I)alamin adenosyltransferase